MSIYLQVKEAESLSEDPENGSISNNNLIQSRVAAHTTSGGTASARASPETAETAEMIPIHGSYKLKRRSNTSEPYMSDAKQWRRSSGSGVRHPQGISDTEVSRRFQQARWESYST